MTDRWDDLKDRLNRAALNLSKYMEGAAGPEKKRLAGKVQGVELALSYMDECDRIDSYRRGQ